MWRRYQPLVLISVLLAFPAALLAAEAESQLIEQKRLLTFLSDKSTFTLIDARSPEEFESSHVDGAINIPHSALADKRTLLPEDLDEPIVIYCKSGVRAGKLADSVRELGYRNVKVLPSRQLMFYDDMIVFNCGVKS